MVISIYIELDNIYENDNKRGNYPAIIQGVTDSVLLEMAFSPNRENLDRKHMWASRMFER